MLRYCHVVAVVVVAAVDIVVSVFVPVGGSGRVIAGHALSISLISIVSVIVAVAFVLVAVVDVGNVVIGGVVAAMADSNVVGVFC